MDRECNQHKPDNLVDAVGYMGINYDMVVVDPTDNTRVAFVASLKEVP